MRFETFAKSNGRMLVIATALWLFLLHNFLKKIAYVFGRLKSDSQQVCHDGNYFQRLLL